MTDQEKYNPVNCDFHDTLEDYSTRKVHCLITYKDKTGMEDQMRGEIADLYTENQREFLKMSDGRILQLDQIKDVKPVAA